MSNDNLRRFKAAETAKAFAAQKSGTDIAPEDCDDCPDSPETAAARGDIPFHGYAALWDVPSGDGRMIRKGGIEWDLETEGIPIIWDRDEGDHSGMVLGRIDSIVDDGIGPFVTGRLFASKDPIAKAAVARVTELIAENALGWSVMIDKVVNEITIRDPEVVDMPDGSRMVRMAHDDDMSTTVSSRLRHLAIVDTPAQPGARPILGPPPAQAAAAAVATYPAEHFAKWDSRDPMPLTTTPDGRIFGHIAGDGCFRNGDMVRCEKYTRDPDPQLRNFHTGTATLDNGDVIRVGSLTAAGLHADTANYNVDAQRHHHENSTTVYAKVVAWEDARGRLCVSGSLVPGLDPGFTAQVAGLPVSIERWPVQGVPGVTLVGAHAVPTPAWPVMSRS